MGLNPKTLKAALQSQYKHKLIIPAQTTIKFSEISLESIFPIWSLLWWAEVEQKAWDS